MKISTTHQRFANILNNQRALSHPYEFLGPNWKDVLNIWIYLGGLSTEQLEIAEDRYEEVPLDGVDIVENAAWETLNACSAGVTSRQKDTRIFRIFNAINAINSCVASIATMELVGVHKILEQGKSLTFVPIFLDL
jgi:hypothetical protein